MSIATASVLPLPTPQERTARQRGPLPLGLVVFVEVDETMATESGTTVVELAELLREFAQELVPTAETSAAVALRSPSDVGSQLRSIKAAIADADDDTGLRLDHAARTVAVGGRSIPLTYREFELLAYLRRHRGRAVTRAELMAHVWPADTRAGSRTVDVHVRRLRVKLGRHGLRLTTLRGHGYRLD